MFAPTDLQTWVAEIERRIVNTHNEQVIAEQQAGVGLSIHRETLMRSKWRASFSRKPSS
jgi:hypothetical protein